MPSSTPHLDRFSTPLRTGRAWGKVILLGEHAVVYGVPALAVGIDCGATAIASDLESGPSRLRVKGWEVDVSEDDASHDLARAFRAARDAAGQTAPMCVDACAELPPGGGLGCSAALGVAVVRALDPDASDEVVEGRAMAWEKIFHGNPSGVDAAVAARGGCLLFEKGCAIEPVRVKERLTLCVGSTGIASSTKSMVEAVARFRERRPLVVEKAFEGIRSLVRNARLCVEAGDDVGLGKLMDLNQMLLSGLFVSSEEIERMCDLARGAGARGAKLTGAGGGGCVVALVAGRTAAEHVIEAWKREGYAGFAATVAGDEAPTAALSPASP